MKKAITISGIFAAASVALVGAALAETGTTYNFTGFDELDVSAGVEVNYQPAEAYSIVAHFRRGGPEDLKIRQDGGRLIVTRKTKTGWGDHLRVTVEVRSPELTAIEASSGSSVEATGISADTFELRVSSGADVDISGTCQEMTVKASSGGSADAQSLKCERVFAKASSGGNVEAYASTQATGKTSSGGSIDIWGDPPQREANTSISGGSTDFH